MLAGCAVPVDRYNINADNQIKIRSFNHKFSVGKFTATKTHYKVMCRLANNVEMPDGESFEAYIQNALIHELKMADAYSKDSDVSISANLNNTNVSSGITDAHWTFDITISNSEGKSFTVKETRKYNSSFLGAIACGADMPKSFLPTVQDLINKIINDPQFDGLFLSKK